jgi:hypothetical protein
VRSLLAVVSQAGSATAVRSSSPCSTPNLQQQQPVAGRSAGASPSSLHAGPDQPSSRLATPPSRPPSSSTGVPLPGSAAASSAATASSALLFPKQERISPAAAVAMASRLAPDDVALALTSSSSSAGGKHHQAHYHHHQQQQLMAATTPGCYDVQTAAAMLFGVPPPVLPQNMNGAASGYASGVQPAAHHRPASGAAGSSGSPYGTSSPSTASVRSSQLQSSAGPQVQNGKFKNLLVRRRNGLL